MKQKLLFVLDLGHFKAFRIINDETSPQPRLYLLESFVPAGSHGKISDKVTDEAGRRRGGSPDGSVSSYGERHNLALELERRTVQLLADQIKEVCDQQPEPPLIYLAAHKEINHQIIDRLPAVLRNNITKNLQEDLVKVHQTELLGHFRHAEMAEPAAR